MTKGKAASLGERLLSSRLISAGQLAAAQAVVGADDRTLLQHLVRRGLLTPFQAEQLRAGKTSFHVGNYVVVEGIGRGGAGLLFKARHTLLPDRHVTLKTLDTQTVLHPDETLARFRREIAILSRLDHPNIVRAYDVLRQRSRLFLVLEYLDGWDLGHLVRQRGPLPVGEAVDCVIQAAQALSYLHRAGIVHRDLKPANLVRTRQGAVKLLDFGLARVRGPEGDSELTREGACLGTPQFMAPEQAEDARQADVRSDLYSLGATLFHLLTGKLPIPGRTSFHRLQHLLLRPPQPLAQVCPGVPPGLAAVVDRLRGRNPSMRPTSAKEVVALLTPFAGRVPADEPSQWEGRRKAALVLEVLQGRMSAAAACRRYGLSVAEWEQWRRRFLEGAARNLDPAPKRNAFGP
jgi:serine/threonine protein kinase